MSFEFCSQKPTHGWPVISTINCNANIILLLVFSGILSIEILTTILSKVFKKNFRFGLMEAYRRSIFSYLPSSTLREKASRWLLYYITSHGILFIRPLGYILSTLITYHQSWYLMAIFISTITDTIFFFNVFFVIFFFGMKIEMLHVAGNPAVSIEERQWFLNTVLKRSSAFALLCFCAGMLRLPLNRSSFTLFDQKDSPLFDWSVGMIQYVLLFTLAFSRRSYFNYPQIMLKQKIKQNKLRHLNLSFTQHLNTQVLTSEEMLQELRKLDEKDEKKFVQEFTNQISKQFHISSDVFQKKTLNEKQSTSFPLIDNTRERYIVGILGLICIILDSLLNASTSVAGMVYKILRDAEHDYENPIYNITYVLMISYIVETVILSICSFVVVCDKANFGGSVDQRESNGNQPSGRGSLNNPLLENHEVSLIVQQRPELIHSTNVPQSSAQFYASGVCQEVYDVKTQERDNSSIHINDI